MAKQYGFTYKDKILDSTTFKQVFKQSIRVSTPYFALLAKQSLHSCARLGISVAKRDAALAVTRSRLKRIFRESFRHHKALLGGYDIVVCVRKNCQTLENNALRKMVDAQWQKLSSSCTKYYLAASAGTNTQ